MDMESTSETTVLEMGYCEAKLKTRADNDSESGLGQVDQPLLE